MLVLAAQSRKFCERVLRTKRFNQFDFECDFNTVVVDPPRTGLDARTRQLISQYRHIIYISCSPDALRRDLGVLCKGEGEAEGTATHEVQRMAVFDHFPYTQHVECGVYLRSTNNTQ